MEDFLHNTDLLTMLGIPMDMLSIFLGWERQSGGKKGQRGVSSGSPCRERFKAMLFETFSSIR